MRRRYRGELTKDSVIVWDYKDAVEVYSLGFFGKPVGLPRVKPNEPFHRPLQLSVFDALYLLEHHVIDVWNKEKQVSQTEFLEFATQVHQHFIEKYTVYRDFRKKGYVVRSGLKFGVDFLVYERGPGVDHSPFMVDVYFNKDRMDPIMLLRAGRLANTVNKSLIIATLEEGKPHYYVFNRFKP